MFMRNVVQLSAVGLLLAACGGGGGDAAGPNENAVSDEGIGDAETIEAMDELYQAAVENEETQIVTYGPGEERYQPVYERFMQRYPEIQVVPEYIFGAPLATRLDQEFGSGQQVGSLVNGGPNITLLTSEADRCESYAPFTAGELDSSLVGPQDTFHGFGRWLFGLAYNTDKVSAEEAPTAWADLTDPRWAGQLVLTDPTTINDSSVTIAGMLYDGSYDEQWLRDLAANDPTIVANSQLAGQELAAGQASVNVIMSYNAFQDLASRDLPVEFVVPEAPRLETHFACLLEGNPSPNASRLLLNWLYTPEGQQAFADAGLYSVFPDGPSPDGLPTTSEVQESQLAPVPLDEYRQATSRAIELAQQVFA